MTGQCRLQGRALAHVQRQETRRSEAFAGPLMSITNLTMTNATPAQTTQHSDQDLLPPGPAAKPGKREQRGECTEDRQGGPRRATTDTQSSCCRVSDISPEPNMNGAFRFGSSGMIYNHV